MKDDIPKPGDTSLQTLQLISGEYRLFFVLSEFSCLVLLLSARPQNLTYQRVLDTSSPLRIGKNMGVSKKFIIWCCPLNHFDKQCF